MTTACRRIRNPVWERDDDRRIVWAEWVRWILARLLPTGDEADEQRFTIKPLEGVTGMDKTAETSATGQLEFDLLDVSRMPLREIVTSDDSVLANAMQHVLAELDAQQEVVATFSNRAG